MLRVRDTGPGVAAQNASSLFTPFFTTKAPGHGTGLGLSLSYGLVKSHGGELSYDPPLEGGAEFRVTLPLHDAPAETAEEAEPESAHPPEARRVLVVDADPGGPPTGERVALAGRDGSGIGTDGRAGTAAGGGSRLRPHHR